MYTKLCPVFVRRPLTSSPWFSLQRRRLSGIAEENIAPDEDTDEPRASQWKDRHVMSDRNMNTFLEKIDPPKPSYYRHVHGEQQMDGKLYGKLSSTLEKRVARELPESAVGMISTTGDEIANVLSEIFATNTFYRIFKGTKRLDEVIEIEDVKVNQDYSHATVYWSSTLINNFLILINKKFGPEEYNKMYEVTTKKVDSTLQRLEPKLRSILAKKMSFRRVPRLYFKNKPPIDATKDRITE